MSYKNQLQEYYQKSEVHKTLPLKKVLVYSDVRDYDSGMFISTLTTPHGTFTSKPKPRKVEAQISAAKRALDNLSSASLYEVIELSSTFETTVIVDVENYSDFLNRYKTWKVDDNVRFVAVMSSTHPLAEKQWPGEIRKVVVHSTRKDAADTAIVMYLMNDITVHDTTMPDETRSRWYVVLTRDHFASNVRDVLASVEFPLCPDIDASRYVVDHIVSYEELYRRLSY